MGLILPYDTETSGLPLYRERSSDERQPHLVQLGAVLVDEDSRDIKEQMSVIIRPDGWDFSPEAVEKHGITVEQAMDEGIPEKEAFEQFLELWKQCEFRVGHNEKFDARIMRIATFRYASSDIIDAWDEAKAECTMNMSKDICQIPASAKARRFGKIKNPNLGEAYKHFTGNELKNAHDALADTLGCMAVYFGVKDHLAAQEAANYQIQL